MSLLSVKNLTVRFGGLTANDDISFDVGKGTIHAVIGPNGAGKTTLFSAISGFQRPTAGEVHFEGQRITGLSPDEVAGRGLVRTFQLVQLFKDLTATENVLIGCHRVTAGGIGAALLRSRSTCAQEARVAARAGDLLAFVGLAGQAQARADTLPYGQQRLLEVARALASEPSLILLDEPAAGLNVQETEHLAATIEKVSALGVTVLLVEHDMSLVMRVAQRITVIDFGRKIAEGEPDAIRSDPQVLAAYLGGTEHAA